MQTGTTPAISLYRAGAALVTWLSIALSFYMFFSGPAYENAFSTFDDVINFFSYFTILSNLLVATTLTVLAISPASSLGRFVAQPIVRGGVALCITITGLVYWLVLSRIYFADVLDPLDQILLHYVTPVLYLLDWLLFVPKGTLRWSDVRFWLLFPSVYALYSLVHGAFVSFYPYPFINVLEIGYGQVLMNVVLLVGVFVVAGLILIAIDRWLGRMRMDRTATQSA